MVCGYFRENIPCGLLGICTFVHVNKNLGLNYYANMKDAPLSNLLRKDSINTENKLMDLSNSSCQCCPDTGRHTGAYFRAG